jgi:hypothetical protein
MLKTARTVGFVIGALTFVWQILQIAIVFMLVKHLAVKDAR